MSKEQLRIGQVVVVTGKLSFGERYLYRVGVVSRVIDSLVDVEFETGDGATFFAGDLAAADELPATEIGAWLEANGIDTSTALERVKKAIVEAKRKN